MEQQPDLSFYFALHQAQRSALRRYQAAVAALHEQERSARGRALRRWARGFVLELEEHHYVEDRFFFPSLRAKVPSAGATMDVVEADHVRMDDLLARWPMISRRLADSGVPFADARSEALAFVDELRTLIDAHLAVEDQDVLPLFWRHYSAQEYDALSQLAIKKGKKAGMWFIAPFCVDSFPAGSERDAFLAAAPGALRLLHRMVRPRYDRLVSAALGAS